MLTRMSNSLRMRWLNFWMGHAGMHPLGRLAARLAGWATPPYKGRAVLARDYPAGYIAPSATIHHRQLRRGAHVFLGERVVIYQQPGGGPVQLDDRVQIHNDTIIEVGPGGSLQIGANSTIQPRCQFAAYAASIRIGAGVQIAPACAFYPYDHGTAPDLPIAAQPLRTRGGIVVEDDAWLGYGVVVLSGVRIGRGAVVGANAVVTRDVPDGAVVAGSPARVVRFRHELDAPGLLR
jgi:acetyltransferase-like isoleucine patch superfamily enzyme